MNISHSTMYNGKVVVIGQWRVSSHIEIHIEGEQTTIRFAHHMLEYLMSEWMQRFVKGGTFLWDIPAPDEGKTEHYNRLISLGIWNAFKEDYFDELQI